MTSSKRTGEFCFGVGACITVAALLLITLQTTSPFIRSATSIELINPTDPTSGEPIRLPDSWLGSAPNPSKRYRFSLPAEVLEITDPYLFLPKFERQASVFINDAATYQLNQRQRRGSYLGSNFAAIPIDKSLLNSNNNQLIIELSSAPNARAVLSPPIVDEWLSVQRLFAIKSFSDTHLGWLGLGVLLIVFVFATVFSVYDKSAKEYRLLSIAAGFALLLKLGVIFELISSATEILPWLFALTPIIGYAMVAFSFEQQGITAPKLMASVTIALIAVSFTAGLLIDGGPRLAGTYISAPLLAIGMLTATGGFLLGAHRRRGNHNLLLAAGTTLTFVGVSHDILSREGLIQSSVTISNACSLLLVIGVSGFLVTRQAETIKSLAKTQSLTEAKLKRKERQLKTLFEEQSRLIEKSALLKERSRMTAELHDGVASNLVTIVAICSAQQHQEIKAAAKQALIELRLLLDAFSVDHTDLATALMSARSHLFAPLKQANIELHWHISEGLNQISPRTESLLHVVRIIQEAISNAVRHGKPQKISLTARLSQPDRVAITLENTGGQPFQSGITGRGISNMRKRVATLNGGTIQIDPVDDGTRVLLTFSCNT